MFFCEECRVSRNWPKGIVNAFGRCEICEATKECYDIPSRHLPEPPPKPSWQRQLADEWLTEAQSIPQGVSHYKDGVRKTLEACAAKLLEAADE